MATLLQDLSPWNVWWVRAITMMFFHATSFNQTLCWNYNMVFINASVFQFDKVFDGSHGKAIRSLEPPDNCWSPHPKGGRKAAGVGGQSGVAVKVQVDVSGS